MGCPQIWNARLSALSSNLGILKAVKISRPNLDHKLFISLESKIEMVVGVVTLPPFLIPALWNKGILIHKQATLGKHFEPECRSYDFGK